MPAEPVVRASVRELPAGRALLASAIDRAKVVASPKARPGTRARAAENAKATLSLLISGALRHNGTPEEQEWWALHRAAGELRATITRQSEKLSGAKPSPTPPKKAATAKRVKKRPSKVKVDQSPAARKARTELRNAALARSRKSAKKAPHRDVRTVSGGLPGLGKR